MILKDFRCLYFDFTLLNSSRIDLALKIQCSLILLEFSRKMEIFVEEPLEKMEAAIFFMAIGEEDILTVELQASSSYP